MKNLKKVLALGLSAAMALSMFVTGAGAAFTDQADIKASEAVDMLSALGVINGNPDGSFKPDGTVTRAEMAKMIFVVRNGGKDDASSFASNATSFQDINSHWAAGYIKYCQTMGIIAGESATRFNPDGLVTGTQAAKMLLVTMGYDADKAGLVGTTWSQKTLSLASENGLLDDVDATLDSGLPRQYAAQIIKNALDADTVTYNADANTYEKKEDTKLEWKENPNDSKDGQWVNVTTNQTVGKKYMGLSTREGGILESVKKEDSKETFRVETTAGDYTKVNGDYSNLVGQKVKVLLKDDKSDKVYGIYADDDSKVLANSFVNDLEVISSDKAKVKVDGTEYKLDGQIAIEEDTSSKPDNSKFVPVYNMNTTEKAAASIDKLISEASGKADKRAASVKLIDNNDNGKIDRVIVTPVTVKKVTYVSSSSITAGSSYKFEDEVIYDGVKKDDWAVIVSDKYTADDKVHITKADTVSGKVTGTKTKNSKITEVKLDDSWYDVVDIDFNNGASYDCVVVGGIIFDAEETAEGGVKAITYLSALDNSGAAKKDFDGDPYLKAKAYFTDGSNKTIKIVKYNNEKLEDKHDYSTDFAQQILTYTTNSDGNYEVKEITKGNMAGYDSKEDATTNAWKSGKVCGNSLDDDSVVFAQAGTEVKVLSGKTVKDWSDANGSNFAVGTALTKEKNGISYARVASLYYADGTAVPGASKDFSYGFVLEAYDSSKDGDDATFVKLWNGNEEVEAYIKGNYSNTIKNGMAVAYMADGKWIKTNVTHSSDVTITSEKAAITGYQEKSKGEVNYLMSDSDGNTTTGTVTTKDSDCVYIGVNTKDKIGVGGDAGSVQLADEITTASGAVEVKQNAYIFHDSSKIFGIVYDTENNEWDGGKTFVKSAAPQYDVTNLTATAITDSTANTKTFTIEANKSKAEKGEEITLTIKLAEAVPTDKVVTVKVTSPVNETVEIKAGATEATIKFTMPGSKVEVAATAAETDKA